MAQRVILAVALAAALVFAGCCASPQAREQIKVAAAVCDGNLREWTSLTDEQKRIAHEAAARAFHDLNWSINGVPLPEEYKATPAGGGGQ